MLYELLTGELPFTGENFVAVAMRHINEEPPSIRERRPDVPARVEAAVHRAMAKDPQARFQTMSEFCQELEACLAEASRLPAWEADASDATTCSPMARKGSGTGPGGWGITNSSYSG